MATEFFFVCVLSNTDRKEAHSGTKLTGFQSVAATAGTAEFACLHVHNSAVHFPVQLSLDSGGFLLIPSLFPPILWHGMDFSGVALAINTVASIVPLEAEVLI